MHCSLHIAGTVRHVGEAVSPKPSAVSQIAEAAPQRLPAASRVGEEAIPHTAQAAPSKPPTASCVGEAVSHIGEAILHVGEAASRRLPGDASPCAELVRLLARAVGDDASDLHLSAGLAPRVRVHGEVVATDLAPLPHKRVLSMVHAVMDDNQRRQFAERLEADFSFEQPGLARFRVNAFMQRRGCAAVFRTIPAAVPSLEELAAPGIFREIVAARRGLVLVTGPTGSGKSTTLAAMVDHINTHSPDHIITIEDPIEFVHESKRSLVNQREVHQHTRGFAAALRSALREDPDVILIGELRDLETIRLALAAAETGHLVLATLHTSSAAKTVDRIVEVFPGAEKVMVRGMLAESLRAVIAQVLLRRCGGGRIAAHEVMIATPAIRNLVREGKVAQMYSVIQTGRVQGMWTLQQNVRKLLEEGLVPAEAARPYDQPG